MIKYILRVPRAHINDADIVSNVTMHCLIHNDKDCFIIDRMLMRIQYVRMLCKFTWLHVIFVRKYMYRMLQIDECRLHPPKHNNPCREKVPKWNYLSHPFVGRIALAVLVLMLGNEEDKINYRWWWNIIRRINDEILIN